MIFFLGFLFFWTWIGLITQYLVSNECNSTWKYCLEIQIYKIMCLKLIWCDTCEFKLEETMLKKVNWSVLPEFLHYQIWERIEYLQTIIKLKNKREKK